MKIENILLNLNYFILIIRLYMYIYIYIYIYYLPLYNNIIARQRVSEISGVLHFRYMYILIDTRDYTKPRPAQI